MLITQLTDQVTVLRFQGRGKNVAFVKAFSHLKVPRSQVM